MQTASRAETGNGEVKTPRADEITAVPEPVTYRLERGLLGPPLHTDQLEHERLGKPTALAVFASDAMSPGNDTGRLLVLFSGRRNVAGIDVWTPMTVEGTVGEHRDHLAILNPAYTLHAEG